MCGRPPATGLISTRRIYALSEEAGLGFSPFGIDSEASDTDPLSDSYRAMAAIAPLLLEHQSAGDVHGFALNRDHPTANFTMNGYTLHVSVDNVWNNSVESGFGLIMADGKDAFLGVGEGVRVTFTRRDGGAQKAGIAAVDEGVFRDGQWISGRRLNGDEDEQGVAWRFESKQVHTEKIALYPFEWNGSKSQLRIDSKPDTPR